MNAVTVERPPPYVIHPGRCAAPVSPDRLDVRCDVPALLYPCGRRCETHKPKPHACGDAA